MPQHGLPTPGTPVRGSTSGRPIMVLLDLLGRRWTLRTIWELRSGGRTFRALQAAMDGVSSSVLTDRLRELRHAAVVEHGPDGYALTARGRDLLDAFEPLQRWAEEHLPPR